MNCYQSKYWAYAIRLKCASNSIHNLSRSIANASVDLNPHQVRAALFALQSPISKGVILADEVGLGKTIEAGLVIAQRWAEKKRNILLIDRVGGVLDGLRPLTEPYVRVRVRLFILISPIGRVQTIPVILYLKRSFVSSFPQTTHSSMPVLLLLCAIVPT